MTKHITTMVLMALVQNDAKRAVAIAQRNEINAREYADLVKAVRIMKEAIR